MSHNTQNVENYHSGDDLRMKVTAENQNGEIVDVTGATVRWVVSEKPGGETIISKEVGAGIEIIDGPNGRFDILVDGADTDPLSGVKYHECRMTDTDGNTSVLFSGRFVINEDTA